MYLKKFPEILNLKFSRILPNLAENKFRDREPRVEIVFFLPDSVLSIFPSARFICLVAEKALELQLSSHRWSELTKSSKIPGRWPRITIDEASIPCLVKCKRVYFPHGPSKLRGSLFMYHTRREKPGEAGRGGSAKIKSHSLKIKWTLRGSFSSVSMPMFATKYSLECSWRDLSDLIRIWDLHHFATLQSQIFSKLSPKEFAFSGEKSKYVAFFSNFPQFSLIVMKCARMF